MRAAAAGTQSAAGATKVPSAGKSGTAVDSAGRAANSGTAGNGTTGSGAAGSGTTAGVGGASAMTHAAGSGASAGVTGQAGAGGTLSTGAAGAGTTTMSSCLIPTFDTAKPPTALALTGNLGTHDPAVLLADGTYYLFATGNGIAAKTSTDMLSWKGAPDVFAKIPSWVSGQISGVTNIWAPDISSFGGVYHLYYAVSSFGSNKSCIGHATRASMSSGSWADQGSVICSNIGSKDDWNAIDPNVIVDDAGTPWMAFGSFWSGIKLIKLTDDGKRADDEVLSIASSKSIEGPFIVHQCDYYYLFVSFGACCGDPYDYNIRVGRSKSVTGPYLDKAGNDMVKGGGTQLVKGNTTWTAPGHNAIVITPEATYNVYHALNASHANATLRISQLALDADGWPVSGGP
jgi:arabinan endo-1,5-alpha-L-arabinosidase